MSHDELVKLIANPAYEVCRDSITEALSYKLNKYEFAVKDNLKHNNINFRVNYKPTKEEEALLSQRFASEPNPLAADQQLLQ